MPYLLISDFRKGQDTRKSKLTAPAGTLTSLINAHITPGGEIEKRKAFVAKYTLPTGTFGLAVAAGVIYAFGSEAPPSMPAGVTYQRLQHPDGTTAMTAMLKAEPFNGLPYVVAQFADATIEHYYNGARVTDFFDGRARASFDVTGGSVGAATHATTQFTVTGGTASPGVNDVSSITVNGIEVLGAAVDWVTSNTATGAAIASQINTFTSSPEYTASAASGVVTITATTTGTGPNGFVVSISVAGNVTTTSPVALSGGVTANSFSSVKVNNIEVLGSAVVSQATNSGTAAAIATQLNSFTSSPDYTATSEGAKVFVIALAAALDTANGFQLAVTTTGNALAANLVDMAGGQPNAGTFTPGPSAKTIKTKMYVVSGPDLFFSKVGDPTKYTTDQPGAGFINMSSNASGAEELVGLENYFNNVAIFSRTTVQIWFVAADDTQNAQVQVVSNAGANASRSIIAYNDGGVFHLAPSGIRSVRARDYSNTAIINEVGAPIDADVVDYIQTLADNVRDAAVAVIEPITNRYWIAVGSKVYVFSYFPASEIAAWSQYDPGFQVTDWAVSSGRVYARSDDVIYLYGGDDNATYDSCDVTIDLPFADASTPGTAKTLTSIDAACEGTWTISIGSDPTNPDARELVATVTSETFSKRASMASGVSTHFSALITSSAAGYQRFSQLGLFYTQAEAE